MRLPALLLALLLPLAASAATAPPDTTAHVYLGHVNDAGRFDAPTFANVPVIKSSLEATTDVHLDVPVMITAREGVRLHSAASPHADTVGRLASGARVRLLAVHNSFGYVWGEIDTGGAKVLATRPRAYSIDGFTGRSGTGPTPAGDTTRNLASSSHNGSAAGLGVRRLC